MINKEQFLEQFKEILEWEGKELTLDQPFSELDSWDSLALLSVIAMIDDEYDLIIKGNQFKELITINDIINYIESKS
jgi:acyl carrier protein